MKFKFTFSYYAYNQNLYTPTFSTESNAKFFNRSRTHLTKQKIKVFLRILKVLINVFKESKKKSILL